MKKIIPICFLLFFVASVNAQENIKPKWSELNQDQLNQALTKSKKTIGTGKILTFSGLGLWVIGANISLSDGLFSNGSTNHTNDIIGASLVITGMISTLTGIPVWIVGGTRKKNITLALARFNTPGSVSINGIGLKIRF